MNTNIRRFLRDESGATTIEYGLIAALLAIAVIVAISALGTGLSAKFNSIATSLNTASH